MKYLKNPKTLAVVLAAVVTLVVELFPEAVPFLDQICGCE